MTDEFFMERCLQLARLASGDVAPNPMVGAVLVHQGTIIGEGYHQRYGEAHAEVNCINSVAESDRHLIAESVLYVSLEPCAHFGKTPPCTDLIISYNIPAVRIGCIDIFQKVHGKGVLKLQEAGIAVETGICEKECVDLNRRFFTFHSFRRPYIVLKWAQSSNGMIGRKGEKVLISNPYTNILVHKWRSEESAILVGARTAINDDPLLTNRSGRGKNPVRIVLAKEILGNQLQMFRADGDTWLYHTSGESRSHTLRTVKIDPARDLEALLDDLYDRGIQSVLVEGGACTHQRFLDKGLWDECRIITNRKITISEGIAAAKLPGVKLQREEEIMDDLVQYYVNSHNTFIAYH